MLKRAEISKEEFRFYYQIKIFLSRAFLEKINMDTSSLKTWRREWRDPGIKMGPGREKIAV